MGRFFAVLAFAAVAWLLGPAPVLAEEPSAIGIIKVRQEVDGAGPSNVFRLQRNIVVLADPLKADIKAYDMETKAALGSCGMPRDFKPWRLVRSRDTVSIVDEAERSTIEIPRAQAFGARCRLKVRPYNAARDGYHRLRRVDNRTIAVPPRRWERGRPLTVRAAAFELLSVRELERDAAGNRYVLAKVLQPKDKARAGQIGVAVTVLRYDPLGRLNGAYRVPFENRKKRAFDYVAVLPAGDLVLALYDEASDQFRLDRIPMPYVTGAKKSIIPANVPNATAQDGFEMATEALAAGHLSGAPTFADAEPSRTPAGAKLQARSGPQIVAEARKYLDQTWDYHTPAAQMTPAPKDEGVYLWRLGNADHKWVQPAHHRGIAAGTKLRGLAYNFGGVDTPATFVSKVKEGVPAGQLGDPIPLPGSSCAPGAPFTATAGLDCSALLARSWGIDPCGGGGRSFSTAALPKHEAICPAPVPSFGSLKEGDAINHAGSHVVIFLRTEAPDGASKMVRVIESASRCSGVCEARYELDAFDGWILHRRTGRSDASCPTP